MLPATDAAADTTDEPPVLSPADATVAGVTDPAAGIIAGQASVPPPFVRTGSEPPAAIAAHAALVADLASGETYVDFNADRRWPTASLAKLATAVVALRHLPADLVITVDGADFPSAEDASSTPLPAGGAYTTQDLLKAMLTISSNEAAEALARAYGEDRFTAALNDLAGEWGLSSTHFSDSTGLSVADQSTARDLLTLARRLSSDYPDVLRLTRQPKATIVDAQSKKRLTLSNINPFAGEADFIGGKTGFTDEAGGNLLSVFTYGRRQVVVVVLGADDRFGETTKLLDWFKANFQAAKP
jgi:D-alanyl-D-alanine carboxypeptidase